MRGERGSTAPGILLSCERPKVAMAELISCSVCSTTLSSLLSCTDASTPRGLLEEAWLAKDVFCAGSAEDSSSFSRRTRGESGLDDEDDRQTTCVIPVGGDDMCWEDGGGPLSPSLLAVTGRCGADSELCSE